jgi:hypothetical protein
MPFSTQPQSRRPHRRRALSSPLNLLAASAIPLLLLSKTHAQDDDEPTSSAAQVSTPFNDPITGLTMTRFFGARTSFGLAMALPQSSTTSSSFIGQMTFPLVNGVGWGAMGLTGDMEGNFILAAWPDGNGGVMASFRQAIDEDNPAEVQGRFQVRPLPGGTSVSNNALTYTFLCEECLNSTLGLGPEATTGDAVMGWALSERAPRGNAADPGAGLGFHERGFGPFTARLSEAQSSGFEAVAATAGAPVANSGRAISPILNIFDGEGDSGDESEVVVVVVGEEGGTEAAEMIATVMMTEVLACQLVWLRGKQHRAAFYMFIPFICRIWKNSGQAAC